MKQVYDAVIIGGGVAGCSAAITLAQRGARVALAEAGYYPKHKVCGEVLSPGCAHLLQQLEVLDQVCALRPPAIHTAHIIAPDGTRWQSAFAGPALGISRYALDQCLVAEARRLGVHVLEQTRAASVEGSLDTQFTVQARAAGEPRTLRARVVIGAQGKRSSLDRVFDRVFLRQPQPFMGLKAHFCGPALPGRVELHTFPGGYCGLSEIEGGRINACLLVRQPVFQRVSGGDIPTFIAWMQQQNPALAAWFATAVMQFDSWLSISQIPFVPKQVIEHDVLMAGDAAGLIAPLAGDGVEMALRGGRLAALAGLQFLEHQWSAAELRQHYRQAWRQTFTTRLQLGRLLQAVMLRPALLSAGLRVLRVMPALGQALIRYTRDQPFAMSSGDLL